MTESSRIRVDGDAIRVYVVEEMKYGFCATEEYLKTHPDIQVVGKSASLPKAIEEICNMKPQPEIVITEIEFRHPDMDGISLLERVKQHNPRVRLIMVAAFSKPELPWLASVLGAEGFLYHGSKPFRLASAIRTVHSGWPAWDDEPSLQVKEWSDKRITYDERLLLEEFANHPASNKVLATRLSKKTKTIDRHMENLMSLPALNGDTEESPVHCRALLVKWAKDNLRLIPGTASVYNREPEREPRLRRRGGASDEGTPASGRR